MKRCIALILALTCLLLPGCGSGSHASQIVATTLPIYEFTVSLCQGTDITVTRLITEEISCVHDYTLTVDQLQALESAKLVICNGLGLDSFVSDMLPAGKEIYTIAETPDADREHNHHHGENDPHIWLNPTHAAKMCNGICEALIRLYPTHTETFRENLGELLARLEALEAYGKEQLSGIRCRRLVTFHDGFSGLAEAYDLTILRSIEEESGSEASAAQLKELITLVNENRLPAIFTEKNGSDSAARIISRETGAPIYALDMGLTGSSYFDAMYQNIDTLKEALG